MASPVHQQWLPCSTIRTPLSPLSKTSGKPISAFRSTSAVRWIKPGNALVAPVWNAIGWSILWVSSDKPIAWRTGRRSNWPRCVATECCRLTSCVSSLTGPNREGARRNQLPHPSPDFVAAPYSLPHAPAGCSKTQGGNRFRLLGLPDVRNRGIRLRADVAEAAASATIADVLELNFDPVRRIHQNLDGRTPLNGAFAQFRPCYYTVLRKPFHDLVWIEA